MSIVRYKVVKVDTTGLISSNASGELQIQYSTQKWATAPIGGLFVFKTAWDAKKFVGGEAAKYRIFKCRVGEPVKLPGDRLSNPSMLWAAVYAWRSPRPKYRRVWPTGSEAYRLVKLLEEVTPL